MLYFVYEEVRIMRLKLYFNLENNIIDTQYRKFIISWIKHAVQEDDEALFEQMYDANQKKTFSFATILPHPEFQKDKVILDNNQFYIIFSAYNYIYALHLYNSILSQKYKTFHLNQNSMTLVSMSMIPEKNILTDSIKIKMSSPLVVRNHNRETLKDMYYSYEREEFEKYLKINISEQLQFENIDLSVLDGFNIKPIKAKKTVIPVYEKMIECSIGEFELQGKTKLLDYLYKAGIRSKKSNGLPVYLK